MHRLSKARATAQQKSARKIGLIHVTRKCWSADAKNEFDFSADVNDGGDFCDTMVDVRFRKTDALRLSSEVHVEGDSDDD